MAKWQQSKLDGTWRRPGAIVRQISDGDWLAETGDPTEGLYAGTAQEGMDYIDRVVAANEKRYGSKLESVLPIDKEPDPYASLSVVLGDAFYQAATGKGKERHTDGSGVPFEQQPIMTITRSRGLGFALGQVDKKTDEAQRMADKGHHDAAEAELLGAIVYAAAAVLRLREMAGAGDFEDIKIGGSG